MRRLKSDSDSEHEGWTHEDVVNAQKADAAACRAFAGRHIELIADGRAVHTEAELGNATVPPRSYVWEGKYARGKR
jgi:hypothetical protein